MRKRYRLLSWARVRKNANAGRGPAHTRRGYGSGYGNHYNLVPSHFGSVKRPSWLDIGVVQHRVNRQLQPETQPEKYHQEKVAIAEFSIKTTCQRQQKNHRKYRVNGHRPWIGDQPTSKNQCAKRECCVNEFFT